MCPGVLGLRIYTRLRGKVIRRDVTRYPRIKERSAGKVLVLLPHSALPSLEILNAAGGLA